MPGYRGRVALREKRASPTRARDPRIDQGALTTMLDFLLADALYVMFVPVMLATTNVMTGKRAM